jgi:hypothetical protein
VVLVWAGRESQTEVVLKERKKNLYEPNTEAKPK